MYTVPGTSPGTSLDPEFPETPTYALYSETAIAVSTAIGGPLAGVYLISKNFKRLGFEERSKKWLYYGILGTIVFFVLILTIPRQFTNSIPEQIWQIAVAGLMYYLVVKYQQEYIKSHFDNGGPKASAWGAAGYGVLAGFFSLLISFVYHAFQYVF